MAIHTGLRRRVQSTPLVLFCEEWETLRLVRLFEHLVLGNDWKWQWELTSVKNGNQ